MSQRDFRERYGHVILVFRKGGRIKQEHRYDSEGGSREELNEMDLMVGHLCDFKSQNIGTDLIGLQFKAILPWEREEYGRIRRQGASQEEQLDLTAPITVVDVVVNQQTETTTIVCESV
jgi:hypothetical protein